MATLKNQIAEIKKRLQGGNVLFNVQGKLSYQKSKSTGNWGYFPTEYLMSHDGQFVHHSFEGMGVLKYGPTTFTLCNFDILNNRTQYRIKYTDIVIVGNAKPYRK